MKDAVYAHERWCASAEECTQEGTGHFSPREGVEEGGLQVW